jgi:uncharacterized RDD family membrane protein YckC
MEQILDEPIIQTNRDAIKYGGFWPRFGALLLDGLILAPITFGIMYFNIIAWKSSLLMILLTLISIAYKPFLEYSYGATWGKMALKLKVVNLQFERASLQEILLRNVFHIVPSLITLFFSIGLYNDPEFESVTGFMQYSAFTRNFPILQYISYCSGAITLIDAIVLLADTQKRSLHDKIGQTYVIDQS